MAVEHCGQVAGGQAAGDGAVLRWEIRGERDGAGVLRKGGDCAKAAETDATDS